MWSNSSLTFAGYLGVTDEDEEKVQWDDPVMGEPLPPLELWQQPLLEQYLGDGKKKRKPGIIGDSPSTGSINSEEEIHHIIEQRFLRRSPDLKKLFNHVDDIPGASIDKVLHRQFTNAWRKRFPYGETGQISKEAIRKAAKEIYKDHQQYRKVIELLFL